MRTGDGHIAVVTLNFVPPDNHTFKYDRLGRMALENRERYCSLRGYAFYGNAPLVRDRPACWSKIPAILAALETHEWVMWADSDALIVDFSLPLERFCIDDYDMVVQSHDAFFRYIGMDPVRGRERMPINTGVFLMRRCAWALDFLRKAFDETDLVSNDPIWNGIGEQEAMTRLLKKDPDNFSHIATVDGLQNHPKLHFPGNMFVHFYGNFARHRIPLGDCERVLALWEQAMRLQISFPTTLPRFHWSCIQNKDPAFEIERGDLEHYLYCEQDIET